jgi:hypothetical protein
MKLKIVIITALLLAFSTVGFARSETQTTTPDVVVKNLYAAQKAGTGPFFQTRNRALVDRYFSKDLADMIWKDAVSAKGEVGAIDFDPLYNSQDPQITDFVIEKPREAGGPDNAFVQVNFNNNGKADQVDFELQRSANKTWKIVGIYYSDGEDIASTLRYAQDKEFRKEFDRNQTFKGDYMVGTAKCTVTPTLGQFKYRVECGGREGFQLYMVEGNEKETAYIYTDQQGVEKSRFVFRNGATNGRFIDASGKEVKVSRIK